MGEELYYHDMLQIRLVLNPRSLHPLQRGEDKRGDRGCSEPIAEH